jgi:multiple sugar transport system substrate-binding protein
MFLEEKMKRARTNIEKIAGVMLKGAILAGLLLCTTGVLFAGGGQASSGGAATVTVWKGSWWVDAVPKIQEAYKKVAPNVNLVIEVLPINGYFDKAAATILAGDGPDVLAIDATQMGQFFDKSLIRPLDDMLAGYDLSDFAGIINAGRYKGKLYALPFRTSSSIMFYNQTLFQEAGLPFPQDGWTWDDLLAVSRKLSKGDVYGYGIAASADDISNVFTTLTPVVYAFGGEYFNADQTRPTLDDPKTVQAIKWWSDLYLKEKVVPPGSINYTLTRDVQPLFIGGKIAIMIGGDQNVSELAKYPDLKYGFVVPPKGPSTTGGWSYTIPVTAKNPQGAIDYIKWFLLPENLGNLAVRIPARLKATQYGAWNSPIYQTVLKAAMDGRIPPGAPQWTEMQRIIIVELQNILQGAKTAEQGCADMQRQSLALF